MRYDFVDIDENSSLHKKCTEVRDYCCKDLELPICELKYFKISNNGKYSHQIKTTQGLAKTTKKGELGWIAINIGIEGNSNNRITEVVAHETRHVYQGFNGWALDEDVWEKDAVRYGETIASRVSSLGDSILKEGESYAQQQLNSSIRTGRRHHGFARILT